MSDEVFLKSVEHMATYGTALVENTLNTKNVLRKIAERVVFIKETIFGKEFTVTTEDPSTAYAHRPMKF